MLVPPAWSIAERSTPVHESGLLNPEHEKLRSEGAR
jgi:hypothetical protein